MKSENGLDTQLNENASNLSGGQRQRLALARALLHDSPMYIFDEATSNIDVESENDRSGGLVVVTADLKHVAVDLHVAETYGAMALDTHDRRVVGAVN